MNRPDIFIGKSDHDKLVRMANGLVDTRPDVADELLGELERASVAGDDAVPAGTVRMGSRIDYRTEDGTTRSITLVYPADADIAENKVSILTPIGTALLGLSVGSSIDFVANDGRHHLLTVTAVENLG